MLKSIFHSFLSVIIQISKFKKKIHDRNKRPRVGIERSLQYENPESAKQRQEQQPEQNRKENWNRG